MEKQRYVSKELTHFVGSDHAPNDELYKRLVDILNDGLLIHKKPMPDLKSHRFDFKRNAKISENEMYNPAVICFCDIPVQDFGVHISKYGSFGLAFKKSFLVKKGASPLFYISKNSLVSNMDTEDFLMRLSVTRGEIPNRVKEKAIPLNSVPKIALPRLFDDMLSKYNNDYLSSRKLGKLGELDLTWADKLFLFFGMHVFGNLKTFDESLADDEEENYYMEREWRILGNLKFELNDVYRVIIPPSYAKRFRKDVPEYIDQVTFVED